MTQVALGIGVFVLCALALVYFIAITIVVWQVWAGLITDIKRILAARKKTQ